MRKEEKKVVLGAFDALAHMKYEDLNRILGSITIQEMTDLYNKLKYDDYCKRHHISYKNMTAEDFEDAALEEIDEYNSYDHWYNE